MFSKREIGLLIGITLVLTASLSFLKTTNYFLYILLPIFLIILINSLAKKITAFYLDSEIEIDFWKVRRIGYRPNWQLKRDFPAGIFFPLIFSVLTLGNFVWIASLIFEVKPKTYRSARKHGLYKFSEITEDHIGYIAAAGIAANILFAIIGYLIGFESFARLSIYYAFFNMLPWSSLDGDKIFFGNTILWSFLAALVLVGLGLTFLVA